MRPVPCEGHNAATPQPPQAYKRVPHLTLPTTRHGVVTVLFALKHVTKIAGVVELTLSLTSI